MARLTVRHLQLRQHGRGHRGPVQRDLRHRVPHLQDLLLVGVRRQPQDSEHIRGRPVPGPRLLVPRARREQQRHQRLLASRLHKELARRAGGASRAEARRLIQV